MAAEAAAGVVALQVQKETKAAAALAEEYMAEEAAAGVVEAIADVKSLILQGLAMLDRAEVRAAGVSTVYSAEAQASASVPGHRSPPEVIREL